MILGLGGDTTMNTFPLPHKEVVVTENGIPIYHGVSPVDIPDDAYIGTCGDGLVTLRLPDVPGLFYVRLAEPDAIDDGVQEVAREIASNG